MPGGDRTGPLGMGSMTGRGVGFCGALRIDEDFQPGGFGRGRGFRRMFQLSGAPGWRRCGFSYYATGNEKPFNEKDLLKRQKEILQEQLNALEKKLAEFKEESQ